MGVLHEYLLCAFMVVLVHGYDLRTNRKFNLLERKVETIYMELQDVKTDLRVETEKSINLEIQLNKLMNGTKVTTFDDKDSDLTEHHSVVHNQQEVRSQALSVEQRIYDAMNDEKNVRKQFERQMKTDLRTANKHTEIKFTALKETLSAVIDNKLHDIEDKVRASVTVLNESSSSMENLIIQVQLNDDAIKNLKLESNQTNTTLLRHGTKLETIEVDLANSVQHNDEYITNLEIASDKLNTTLLRHGTRLETINDDLANSVQQNNEYITNLIIKSDQLNTTLLRHGTKLETIKVDLANNVQHNDEYITNLMIKSDQLNTTLLKHGTRLETIEVGLANNVKQNDEYITNLKTESDKLNATLLRHDTRLETIKDDLANNVKQNDEYITNMKTGSDKLNTKLLKHSTRLETIEIGLANNVKQNYEYITNMKTESDKLNATLLRHDTRLETIKDDLANNVKQNDEYITNMKTESDKLNTKLLKHSTRLETIEIGLANNVKQNYEYITNLKTESDKLNATLLRHDTRLETIKDDLANNVKQNDEYITNTKTESDKLNTTLLRHGTKLETIADDLANNVKQNDGYITNLKTESDQHGAILNSLNGSLFDVRALVEELIDNSQRYKVCYHGGKHSKDGECECSQPYYGIHCEKVCFNGGKHSEDGPCICALPFYGTQCEKGCFNGGKYSEDGLCVCALPFYSTQCEKGCFNGGKYSEDGLCECAWPYHGSKCSKVYTDCYDIHQHTDKPTGIYTVIPRGSDKTIEVKCEMDINGGGWTVFQYRHDGSVDFFRKFDAYENGFGILNGEFWLGLQYIHVMTSSVPSVLRIDVAAADETQAYQTYDDFYISEGPDYKLNIGATSGTAGDNGSWRNLLYYNNGQPFSTYDRDRDGSGAVNCAEYYHGAWWYGGCGHYVNLNGHYTTPGTRSTVRSGWGGMIHYQFKKVESLKSSKIMFRRK